MNSSHSGSIGQSSRKIAGLWHRRDALKRVRMFDTVGARVMALIVATTLPLATIAAFLAWHNYQQNVGFGVVRAERDAETALAEIVTDLAQTHTILDMLGDGDITAANALREFSLIQSISRHHYCSLMLTDPAGHPTLALPPPVTQDPALCRAAEINRPEGEANVPVAGVDVLYGARGPLIRFVVPVLRNGTLTGYITAIRLIGWQSGRLPKDDARLLLGTTDNAQHFLVTPSGSFYPLFLDHPSEASFPAYALSRLKRDVSHQNLHDVFTRDGVTYVLQNAYGPVSLVVTTQRTSAENRALNIFLIRVSLIAGLLVLELLGVAIGARNFLVDPLENLASAVADWRRGAPFAPRVDRSIPLEIRHLEKAFLRATRRLTRHEEELELSARNQDMLIREIHHRVKNNLQVVASLLNLQSNRIRSDEAREEFRLVRDRVRALATLHRHLYSESGFSAPDTRAFLEELCNSLMAANGMNAQTRVKLRLDVEQVLISPDQATPIALIVTEVVGNALRYAFPNHRSGHILISLRHMLPHESDRAGLVEFKLGDDGVGVGASRTGEVRANRDGIGIQLIRGFARQLKADLTVSDEGGTWYILNFVPVEPSLSALAMARNAISPDQDSMLGEADNA